MKKIDWTKPLRRVGDKKEVICITPDKPVVLNSGESRGVVFDGVIYTYSENGRYWRNGPGDWDLENVPEPEPKTFTDLGKVAYMGYNTSIGEQKDRIECRWRGLSSSSKKNWQDAAEAVREHLEQD